MSSKARKRGTRRLALAAVLALAGVCVGQAVQQVVVNRPDLPVLAGMGSIYARNPVARVQKGTTLQVLKKEENGWLRVKAGNVEGYVREDALSAKDTKAADGFAAFLGGSEASAPQAGAAGKGLEKETIEYADAKGQSPANLNRMIAGTDKIAANPKLFEDFRRAGKLGPYKQR